MMLLIYIKVLINPHYRNIITTTEEVFMVQTVLDKEGDIQAKPLKKYIAHIQAVSSEYEVPIFAESIDEAAQWVEDNYEVNGFVCNRIRQAN